MKWTLLLQGISNRWFEQLLWTTQVLKDFILKNSVYFVFRVSTYYYWMLEKETIQSQQTPPTLCSISTIQTRIAKRIHSFACLPTDYSLTIFHTIVIITFGDKLLRTFHCLSRKITVTTWLPFTIQLSVWEAQLFHLQVSEPLLILIRY